MRLVGFETEHGSRLGVLEEDRVVDLQAADPRIPGDLGQWLLKKAQAEGWDLGMAITGNATI